MVSIILLFYGLGNWGIALSPVFPSQRGKTLCDLFNGLFPAQNHCEKLERYPQIRMVSSCQLNWRFGVCTSERTFCFWEDYLLNFQLKKCYIDYFCLSLNFFHCLQLSSCYFVFFQQFLFWIWHIDDLHGKGVMRKDECPQDCFLLLKLSKNF